MKTINKKEMQKTTATKKQTDKERKEQGEQKLM